MKKSKKTKTKISNSNKNNIHITIHNSEKKKKRARATKTTHKSKHGEYTPRPQNPSGFTSTVTLGNARYGTINDESLITKINFLFNLK